MKGGKSLLNCATASGVNHGVALWFCTMFRERAYSAEAFRRVVDQKLTSERANMFKLGVLWRLQKNQAVETREQCLKDTMSSASMSIMISKIFWGKGGEAI